MIRMHVHIHTMDTKYKELHREAISNQTGSSLLETYTSLFPLPIHIIIFIWMSTGTNHSKKINSPTVWMFLFEFITMVLPTVFNLTLFSDYSVGQFLVYISIFSIAFIWMLLNNNYISSSTIKTKKNPYMTVYRFMLNTYTVFCILAVDFNVFPRRFAKTETYGHSIMDIGVGCYVCSNALLFSIPNTQNMSKIVLKVFKQVLPLLVLGIGRTYFVTKAEYHHYVFEYGVHWNFFMTLAFLKIINLFMLPFVSTCCLSGIATILVFIYEFALNFGLADWIMSDAPRDTMFSANREGIFSLIGYEAIFLYSLSMKSRFSIFMNKNHLINSMFLLIVTASLSIALFLLTFVISFVFGVSRRLANAGYVYWILSISSYLLFMSLIIENFITILLHKMGQLGEFNRVSLIIDSINDNLLLFFLFANVTTGVINMCLYTLVMNAVYSLTILSLYMFVIYFTIYILQNYKKKIV
ncbi:PREDICTED: phosphatidylinositol-glycan biosynthesis class W protein-like isoform X1 [Diuraphis noxia]|uniref:phosphatidylinositol-glycan biosynthesis class W protein-like isoform X1 n=2 Tax=Diuraphis noxia TaxID=143948 RepID=UPI0007638545|nr:PREDICTED: phosphatidylinositol-glycan biosynthesis class W protein-like isoform X1 [Diuraphis noxia]XP_015369210.1 PREDICTED: phosphatidylinositol-glycan biosynthesis class W protein-like isoform X1 [Diuraphis noxia]XP_015369211.1 PREDICTED: phosphatidylinositol-glycan biosynthesis class W protein-like isoform X1 [Diuraphis noxia]